MDAHNNYDSVFKDALVLFKDKSLDFLGLQGIAPITEPLRTENVKIEIVSEFQDLTFGTQDGGGLHFEEEVKLSIDDMFRFSNYHISLSRVYKREFTTVIFVKEPTNIKELRTKQLTFTPIIVQCSEIDADAMLARLRKGIADNTPVNELELIYLPLFHSKVHTPTALFNESMALVKAMQSDDYIKRRIFALSFVLASKVVEKSVLNKHIEELKHMGNVIIEVFEEYGAKKNSEEIARKMLADKLDPLDIIKYTGIDAEELRKMRDSMLVEAM